MPLSDQISTYTDAHRVLEATLENGGVYLELESPGQAKHFRMRCHYYRKLLREEITRRRKTHELPRTKFDPIKVTVDPDNPCRLLFKIEHGIQGKLTGVDGKEIQAPESKPEDYLNAEPSILQPVEDELEAEAKRLVQSLNLSLPEDNGDE